MPHERRARLTERDLPKLDDIEGTEPISERRQVEGDRRSQLLVRPGDTGARHDADASQREPIRGVIDATRCLEICARLRSGELAAAQPRELRIEPRGSDNLESKRGCGHQRAELKASTKVLVAMRSANRISSDGAIAMITLPMRSTETVPSGRRGWYGAPDSDRTSRTSASAASSSTVRPAGALPMTGTAMTSTRAPGAIAPPTALTATTGLATARSPGRRVRPVWKTAASAASAWETSGWPCHSGAIGTRPMASSALEMAPAGSASGGTDRTSRSSALSGLIAATSWAATIMETRCAPM